MFDRGCARRFRASGRDEETALFSQTKKHGQQDTEPNSHSSGNGSSKKRPDYV
jgi:hypothetical protein